MQLLQITRRPPRLMALGMLSPSGNNIQLSMTPVEEVVMSLFEGDPPANTPPPKRRKGNDQ